ncbi:MAG: type II toxin-antitoxin system VapB family antitoxin [Permianibacter sp.]
MGQENGEVSAHVGARLNAQLGAAALKDACSVDDKTLACVWLYVLVHIMRTNIEIDDKLMSDALRLTGLKTKKEAVELGLRTLLRLRQQEELRRFRGKLQWEGDLNAMRTDK